MFFDIVDITTTYIQYLILLMRISPDSFPEYYTKPFRVLKYFVLDFFSSVDEQQRYNNPLRVSLPDWLPLDVRLQFVCTSVIAPLALATLGVWGTSNKLGYVWLVITLGALFMFAFGAALVANPTIATTAQHKPSHSVRIILISVGIPAFLLCLAVGIISAGRSQMRQRVEREENLRVFLEEEKRQRELNPVTQSVIDREHLSVEALASERARKQERVQCIEKANVVDIILQAIFTVLLFIAGLFFKGVITSESVAALQSTVVFSVIAALCFVGFALSLIWFILASFKRGRKVKESIASFMSSVVLSCIIICCSFLYTTMVTNLVSLLYCADLVCDVGERSPHGASVFPPLRTSTYALSGEAYSTMVGCVDCNIGKYSQKCPAALQEETCGSISHQKRLVYDTRVRCDSIDSFYKTSAIVMFVSYVIFVPLLQYVLARFAVRIVENEYPLEQRFYDIFTEEEIYYEKVTSSKNKAAFMYRAYKRPFKYYKLSFLLQKIVLAVVSCTTRRGLQKDRTWIGLSIFLIVPMLALTCAVALRPFSRPTEAIYLPVLQFLVALCSGAGLAGHQLGRDRVPAPIWVLVAVCVVMVPIMTLIVATILTLRVERRRSDLLLQRLANVFASGISYGGGGGGGFKSTGKTGDAAFPTRSRGGSVTSSYGGTADLHSDAEDSVAALMRHSANTGDPEGSCAIEESDHGIVEHPHSKRSRRQRNSSIAGRLSQFARTLVNTTDRWVASGAPFVPIPVGDQSVDTATLDPHHHNPREQQLQHTSSLSTSAFVHQYRGRSWAGVTSSRRHQGQKRHGSRIGAVSIMAGSAGSVEPAIVAMHGTEGNDNDRVVCSIINRSCVGAANRNPLLGDALRMSDEHTTSSSSSSDDDNGDDDGSGSLGSSTITYIPNPLDSRARRCRDSAVTTVVNEHEHEHRGYERGDGAAITPFVAPFRRAVSFLHSPCEVEIELEAEIEKEMDSEEMCSFSVATIAGVKTAVRLRDVRCTKGTSKAGRKSKKKREQRGTSLFGKAGNEVTGKARGTHKHSKNAGDRTAAQSNSIAAAHVRNPEYADDWHVFIPEAYFLREYYPAPQVTHHPRERSGSGPTRLGFLWGRIRRREDSDSEAGSEAMEPTSPPLSRAHPGHRGSDPALCAPSGPTWRRNSPQSGMMGCGDGPVMEAHEVQLPRKESVRLSTRMLRILQGIGRAIARVFGLEYSQEAFLEKRTLVSRGLLRRGDALLTFPMVCRHRMESQLLKTALARGGAGERDNATFLRPFWYTCTDTMLCAAQVPGSTPPWMLYRNTSPAPQIVASTQQPTMFGEIRGLLELQHAQGRDSSSSDGGGGGGCDEEQEGEGDSLGGIDAANVNENSIVSNRAGAGESLEIFDFSSSVVPVESGAAAGARLLVARGRNSAAAATGSPSHHIAPTPFPPLMMNLPFPTKHSPLQRPELNSTNDLDVEDEGAASNVLSSLILSVPASHRLSNSLSTLGYSRAVLWRTVCIAQARSQLQQLRHWWWRAGHRMPAVLDPELRNNTSRVESAFSDGHGVSSIDGASPQSPTQLYPSFPSAKLEGLVSRASTSKTHTLPASGHRSPGTTTGVLSIHGGRRDISAFGSLGATAVAATQRSSGTSNAGPRGPNWDGILEDLMREVVLGTAANEGRENDMDSEAERSSTSSQMMAVDFNSTLTRRPLTRKGGTVEGVCMMKDEDVKSSMEVEKAENREGPSDHFRPSTACKGNSKDAKGSAVLAAMSITAGGSARLQELRCHYLLRMWLKETFWEHKARLHSVQKATDHKIAGVTRRVLTQLLMMLGVVATVSLALVLCGMMNTVDRSFLSGVNYNDESEAYALAGYPSWSSFTMHCCCVAVTNLSASFPYYALDAENWMCTNGVTKERIRRDGFDNDVYNGYNVRPLCGMEFSDGCALQLKDGLARVVNCTNTSISRFELRRW